jgi:uncharacterized linocin/CFP29 family protein
MIENKYLGRGEAPVAYATWKYLDTCMISVARSRLSGRKLLEIEGPFG